MHPIRHRKDLNSMKSHNASFNRACASSKSPRPSECRRLLALLATLSLTALPGKLTAEINAFLTNYAGGKTGALSLTFDDSLPSHWSVTVPALNARGMRGTFFVITGSVDWEGARTAALAGHEIGSHSTTDAKLVTAAPIQLVPDAEAKLAQSRAAIETEIGTVLPGYRAISFAYPYGITGQESDATNLPDLVSQYFAFSRTAGGDAAHNHPDPKQWAYRWDGAWRFGHQGGPRPDLAYHWISRSLNLSGTAAEAATIANNLDSWAIGQNRWAVFLYHSEGGATNFNLHLDAIDARAPDLWIAPFGEVAQYIRQRAHATLDVLSATPAEILLSLTGTPPDDLPSVPLTISLVRPTEGWEGELLIMQGETTLTYRAEGNRILFDALPDAGEIHITNAKGTSPKTPPLVRISRPNEGGFIFAFTSTGPATHTLQSSPQPHGPYVPLAEIAPLMTEATEEAHAIVLPESSLPHPPPIFFRLAVE